MGNCLVEKFPSNYALNSNSNKRDTVTINERALAEKSMKLICYFKFTLFILSDTE